ncbi:hypothetical protein AB205_0033300 [Aquarana catesbeiana]|uniref:Uncharacterized protein n=1 Tax=Aquarana catesbeiana TaxID=8400 RepID=A0A2G9RBF0_AQUCT|nr:hypothetical protein AB205_0033300 [Aquarana catesbeiana]
MADSDNNTHLFIFLAAEIPYPKILLKNNMGYFYIHCCFDTYCTPQSKTVLHINISCFFKTKPTLFNFVKTEVKMGLVFFLVDNHLIICLNR